MLQIDSTPPSMRGILATTSTVLAWSMSQTASRSQLDATAPTPGLTFPFKALREAPPTPARRNPGFANRMVRLLGLAGFAALVGTSFAPARAYAPAIEFVPGSSPSGNPFPNTPAGTDNLTFGYQFNTLVDRVIDGIAVFDYGNDGLNQFHKVGLWKTGWTGDWQLIGQYAFDPASPTCVTDSLWCWIPIPLMPINRDSTYMIAATWDQAAVPADLLAYRTPPPGPGQSYKTIDTNLNYLFPVRSDPEAVENSFQIICPNPTPVNVDLAYDPNDLTTLCPFPSRRVDVDAGGYFSAVVSFYTPSVQVPAPLPVLGASAMFAWKRRMRQRIKQAGIN